jgi:hypothetical protein
LLLQHFHCTRSPFSSFSFESSVDGHLSLRCLTIHRRTHS